MFLMDQDDDHRIVKRSVSYVPGLFKIFDEILVNAADNRQRDPTMDKLEVTIDAEANTISVFNNGKGVPVQMHKDEGVYVPTLIFGHLLTGSNFDDGQKKTTGGRNGFGAKLANVFSTQFRVECADVESGRHFSQIFRGNMATAETPVIKDLTAAQKKKGDFVRITFSPDLQRFHMTCLDQDIVGLFGRRAYDVAASLAFSPGRKLTVTLNGKKLPIKSFEDYVRCHDKVNQPIAFQKTERWEVGVGLAEDGHGSISFVNSIATTKGGKHVDYITDQIVAHLTQILKKKKHEVTKSYIKNSLFVFVNCLIENPAFDSQTKECLKTKPKQFGSKCDLSPTFLKKVDKSEIVDAIVQYSQFKDQKKLKNTGGRKRIKLTGIPKLDDANFAGSAKSKDCTLIITEGDSAKSLAMAGLSVVGRDYYGVFPLRGKPLNVRDANQKQVLANEEIKNLVNVLGLKYDTKYDEANIKTLRYGHLMIMADQDTDGSHIKGLVINLIHYYWPSLLDVPGFLQQFITPIVKASKGKTQVKTFFNVPEYEQWLESSGNNGRGWTIKYYK
jgi:DNA topoisomerase-2